MDCIARQCRRCANTSCIASIFAIVLSCWLDGVAQAQFPTPTRIWNDAAADGDLSNTADYSGSGAFLTTDVLDITNLPTIGLPTKLGASTSVSAINWDNIAAGTPITIAAGNTLTLNNTTGGFNIASTVLSGITFNPAITMGASQTWTNNGSGGVTFATVTPGTNSLTYSGTGNATFASGIAFTAGTIETFTQAGSGTVTISGALTSRSLSATINGGGTLVLTGGTGAFVTNANKAITITNASRLVLDNTSGFVAQRTGVMPVSLSGGTLQFKASAGAGVTQAATAVGVLTISSGYGAVDFSGSNGTASFTFASLARGAGGGLLVLDTTSGRTIGGAAAATNDALFFTTNPPVTGNGFLPSVFLQGSTGASTFGAYAAATGVTTLSGVVSLAAGGGVFTGSTNTATGVFAAASGVGYTVATTQTLAGLSLGNNTTFSGAGALNFNNALIATQGSLVGSILVTGNSAATISNPIVVNQSTATTLSELIIRVDTGSTLAVGTINASSASGILTKVGGGSLTLGGQFGAMALTGLYVSEGTLGLSAGSFVGAGNSASAILVGAGATLATNGNAVTTDALLGAGNINLGSPNANVNFTIGDNSGTIGSFGGTFVGGTNGAFVTSLLKTGTQMQTLAVPSLNTFTNITVTSGGLLYGGAGGASGFSLSGTLAFGVGNATAAVTGANAGLTFSGLKGAGATISGLTLSTGARYGVLSFTTSGSLTMSGALTRTGLGSLIIRGANLGQAGGVQVYNLLTTGTPTGTLAGTLVPWLLGDSTLTGLGQQYLFTNTTSGLLQYAGAGDIAPNTINPNTNGNAVYSQSGTINVGTGTVGSLTIDLGANATPIVLAGSGAGSSLTVEGGVIQVIGSAASATSVTIGGYNAGLKLGTGINDWYVLTGNNTSPITLTIASPIIGQTLTKEGLGTLVLAAPNPGLTGALTISGSAGFTSTLQIAVANALSSTNNISLDAVSTLSISEGLGTVTVGALLGVTNGANQNVIVGAGDTLRAVGSVSGTLSVQLSASASNLTSSFIFGDSNAATMTGSFTFPGQTVAGASTSVIKVGSGAATVLGVINLSNSGVLRVDQGSVAINTASNSAAISNTGIIVNPGAGFSFTTTTLSTRIGNDSVLLNAGTFTLSATPGSAASTLITIGGPLSLNFGQSTVLLAEGSATGSSSSTFTALNQSNNAIGLISATINAVTGSLGTIANLGTGGSNNGQFLFFTATPTLSGNAGQGFNAAPTNGQQAIVPFVLLDAGTSTVNFATYTTSVGLRPATASGELLTLGAADLATAANSSLAASTYSNVSVVYASAASTTASVSANTWVNALDLRISASGGATGLSLSGGVTLTVDSGLLAIDGALGNTTVSGGAGSQLTFGGGDAFTVNGKTYNQGTIYVAQGSLFQSVAPIVDANNAVTVVKGGAGIWYTNVANAYTGGTVIESGILEMRNSAGLGVASPTVSTSGTVTFSGNNPTLRLRIATVSLASISTVPLGGSQASLPATYSAGTITTANAASVLTLNGGNTTTFAGLITEGAALPLGLAISFSSNTATLTLTGGFTGGAYVGNNFSGGLTLTQGILAVGSDQSIGLNTSKVTFSGTGANAANATLKIYNEQAIVPGLTFNSPNSRSFIINNGTIDLTGVTATIQGALGNGATPGTLVVTGAGGALVINQTSITDTFTGALSLTSGAQLQVTAVTTGLAPAMALQLDNTSTAIFSNVGQQFSTVTNNNSAANALSFAATTGTVALTNLLGTGNTVFASNANITNFGGGSSASVSGTTTIGTFSSTGTLTLGGAATIGTLTNIGTVQVGIGGLTVSSGSFGGAIGGSGGVTYSGGAATITLIGAGVTYSGDTVVSTGTLNASTLASAVVTVSTGANLAVSGGLASTATLSSFGTTSFTAPQSLGNLLGTGAVDIGSQQLTLAAASFAGNITGAGGSLVINGAGQTFTFTGNNSNFGGGTNVQAGAVFVNGGTGGSALGNGGVTLNASTSLLSGSSATVAGTISVLGGAGVNVGNGAVGTLNAGGLTLANNAVITFSAGSATNSLINLHAGALTQSSGATVINILGLTGFGSQAAYEIIDYGVGNGNVSNSSFTIGAAPSGFNYSFDTSQAGKVFLDVAQLGGTFTWSALTTGLQDGSGVWTTVASTSPSANFYNGTNNVWANTGQDTAVFGANVPGTIPYVVTLDSGIATFNVKQLVFAPANASYTITGSNAQSIALLQGIVASNSATVNAPISLQSAQGWSVINTATLTVSAPVSDASANNYGLTLNGPGTYDLTATNSYAGTTTITGAALVNLTGSVASSNVFIDTAAALNMTNATGGLATTATVTNSGTFTVAGNQRLGSLAGLGTTYISNGFTLTLSGGTYNGAFSDSGSLVVAGNVALGGVSLFTGTTTVTTGGQLTVNNGQALQTSVVTSVAANGITFALSNTAYTFGGLTGSADQALAAPSGTMSLALGGISTSNINASYGGALSGAAASLVKVGLGTQTLTGVNTYAGATTVSSGVLVVTNGGSIASNAIVVNGGLLLGNAALSGAAVNLTVTGSTTFSSNQSLNQLLGSSTGTVDIGANTLTLVNGGSYAGTLVGSSKLITQGNLTLSGTLNFTGTLSVSGGLTTLSPSVILPAPIIQLAAASQLNVLNANNAALSANPNVTMGAGATLTLAGSNTVALNGLGLVSVAAGKTLTLTGGSFGGTINSAVVNTALVINSPGATTTFSGVTSSYSGGTTLLAGTLRIAGDGSLGNSAGVLTFAGGALALGATSTFPAGRVIQLGASGNQAIIDTGALLLTDSGPVAGQGTLVKIGTGAITLSSTLNTFSGGVLIQGGTLAATSSFNVSTGASGFGTGTITISGGIAAARNNGSGSNVQINYGNNIVVLGTGTIFVDVAASGTTGNTIIFGTLSTSANTTVTISGVGTRTYGLQIAAATIAGNTTFAASSLGNNFTISGNLTLADSVTTGTTTTATFSSVANTTIAGVISDNANDATKTLGLVKTGAGILALLGNNSYTGGTTISAGIVQINSVNSLGATSVATTLSGGTLELLGSLGTINSTRAFTLTGLNSAITVDSGSIYSLSGTISGSGALAVNGPGTLVLAGVNHYAGGTTINTGALVQINSAQSLGDGVATLTGGTLEVLGSLGTINSTRAFTLTGLNSVVTVDSGSVYSLGGTISGSGAMTVNGPGTLVLTGTNHHTGGTTINASALVQVNNGQSLGDGVATLSGGTLEVLGSLGSIIAANAFTLSANSVITVDSGSTYSMSGTVSGSGGLAVNGPGALALMGVNHYIGGTTINSGALVQINSAQSLGDGAATLSGSTLEVLGSLGVINSSGTFTLSATSAINVDSGSTYSLSGIVGGAGGLNLNGAGTLALAAANLYTGNTTVSAGVLMLGNGNTGSAVGTGNVTVNAAGTLMGTGAAGGQMSGNVTANAGTVSPGVSATSILTISGNLTSTTGSTFNYTLGATNASGLISVGNVLSLTGTTLNLTGAVAGTYSLINFGTDPGNSSFSSVVGLNGLSYTEAIVGNVLQLTLTGAAAPLTWSALTSGHADGDGTWTNNGSTNFWNGSTNVAWDNSANTPIVFGDSPTGTGGTVTLGNNIVVNSITFAPQNAGSFYTIAPDSGNAFSLTISNGIVASNTAVIAAPVVISGSQTWSAAIAGTTLTVTGAVGETTGGSKALTLSGPGMVAMFGNNSYSGGTFITGGTVLINSATSLGAAGAGVTLGAAVLEATTDISSARGFTLSSAASVIQVDSGKHYTLSGAITGSGGLTVAGPGTLVLAGTASIGGVLTVNDAATANVTVTNAATVRVSNVVVGNAQSGSLSILAGSTLTNSGFANIASASGSIGAVTVSGASWTNTGSVYVGGSSVAAGGNGALTVTSSGVLNVAGTLKLWNQGTLTLGGGGSITTTNFDPGSGTFNFNDGTFTVSGGTYNVTAPNNLTISGNTAIALPTFVLAGGATASLDKVYVGSVNQGALSVIGGSTLTADVVDLGQNAGSTGSVTIAGTSGLGAASTITLNQLFVGDLGSGSLAITGGGKLSVIGTTPGDNSVFLGYQVGATGVATVSGTNGSGVASQLNMGASTSFYNGFQGTGSLTITGGGLMTSAVAYLGYQSTASGSATISGAGSTWTNTNSLYVGGTAGASGGTGSITINNSGSLNVGGTLKLWLHATVSLDSGSTVKVTTFDGALGVLNLGGGTLSITGASTNTISSLQGTGTVFLTQAGTIAEISGGSFGGTIGGLGSVTILQNATFTGTNAYSGGTTINNGGALNVLSSGSIASGSNLTVNTGGAATFANAQSLGTVSNGGNLTFTGATATIASLGGAGALTLSGTNLSVTAGGNYSGSLNNGATPGQLTVAGGTLTLGGLDNLTGGITIQSGATLAAAAATALGSNTLSFTGGTLHVMGNINDSTSLVNINASGATINIDSGTTLTLTGANISGSGGITLAGSGTLFIVGAYSGTTTVQSNGTYAASPISAGNVVLNNGSILDFTSSGVYNGTISVSSGTAIVENTSGGIVTISGTVDKTHTNLILEGPGFFWINGQIVGGTPGDIFNSDLAVTTNTTYSSAQAYSGPTTISANATLWLQTTNALPTSTIVNLGETSGNTSGSLNIGASSQTLAGIVAWGSSSGNEITSTAVGNLYVNVASGVDSYSGKLTGGLSLNKEGPGTLELTGTANSYNGGTFVDAGTLQLGANNALPTATTVLVTGTSTLDLLNHSQQIVALSGISSAATVTGSGGTLTVSHTASILSSAFAGAISGGLNVVFGGPAASSQVLNGTSNYTGTTTVDTGALLVNGSIVNNGGAGTLVTVNSGTLGGTGVIQRNISIASGGTISPGVDSTLPATLTVGSSSTATTVAISGTYHYDLHIADPTQAGSSSTHDQITMLGTSQTLTLNSGSTLSLALSALPNGNAYWTSNHIWDLVTGSSLLTAGTFTTLTDGTNSSTANHLGGYSGTNGFFSVDYGSSNLQLDWTATAVPEPGTLLLATLTSLGLGGYGWRKRKKRGSDTGDASGDVSNAAVARF